MPILLVCACVRLRRRMFVIKFMAFAERVRLAFFYFIIPDIIVPHYCLLNSERIIKWKRLPLNIPFQHPSTSFSYGITIVTIKSQGSLLLIANYVHRPHSRLLPDQKSSDALIASRYNFKTNFQVIQ